jgi:hypothetical protein
MAHASNVFKITPEATPYLIAPFKARNRKLWIVLPAFNEAENLGNMSKGCPQTVFKGN